jgi:hypothetical protein
MVRHPVNGNTFWVGGYYYDSQLQSNYMGVARTTDEGASWTFTTLTPDYGIVYGLAFDPQHPETLYAAGYHSGGTRVWKTTDGGTGWVNITGTLPNTVDAIAVHPITTSTVYCGLYNGVYKSTDGGSSWVQKGSFDVNSIAIDPVNPNIMYTGGSYTARASTDAGETWTSISSGLSGITVNDVRVHPVQSGLVYAGSNGAGVLDYWDVSIALGARVVGTDLRLSWGEVLGCDEYWIYGADNQAYFAPGTAFPYAHRVMVLPFGTTEWFTPGGVGDPGHNWTYTVLAVDANARELGWSNRAGEHDFLTATGP